MHHQASIIQHSYTNALTSQDKLSSDHRCSHILFSINKHLLYFLMVLYFSYFLENILVKALTYASVGFNTFSSKGRFSLGYQYHQHS